MTLYNPAYTSPFTPYGSPWTNLAAPALSAVVFDQIEGLLYQIDQPNSTVLNGNTAGTATLYEPLSGIWKVVLCYCSGFRNGGANQSITLPVQFTTTILLIWTAGIPPISLLKSGTAGTVQYVSTTGDPGTTAGSTTVAQNVLAHLDTGCDTIQFNGSQSATNTGGFLLVGL